MRNQVEAYRKLRKVWSINPKEKVVTSKKEYNRQLSKKEIAQKIAEDEDIEDSVHWKSFVDDYDY